MHFYALNRIINAMRLLSDYDLFIFDWDHTLTTSTIAVTVLDIIGFRGRRRKIDRMKEKKPSDFTTRDVEVRERVSRIYSTLDDVYGLVFKPKLKPRAMEMLELLKRKGKKVAIFSDSHSYRLLKEVRMLGVMDHVDLALAAESVGRYKPDPTGLLLISDRFRIGKGRSVYVGDMAWDMLTARLAGMGAIAVADGVDRIAVLKSAEPDRVFIHLGAFLDALQDDKNIDI